MSKRDTSVVVIHHSASRRTYSVPAITRDHLSRGYSHIGYHHIIDGNAELHVGRPFHLRGAHSGPKGNAFTGLLIMGYNGDTVEKWGRPFTDRGGRKRRKRITVPNPGWQWTDAQIARAEQYLDDYRDIFLGSRFIGHRDVKPTLCPGLSVQAVFE